MTPARYTPWEQAVHAVADTARQALGPESHTRIDQAVAIVLAGGVKQTPFDGIKGTPFPAAQHRRGLAFDSSITSSDHFPDLTLIDITSLPPLWSPTPGVSCWEQWERRRSGRCRASAAGRC